MCHFFVNIKIDIPDELAKGYDPTEILENLIDKFIKNPWMKKDGAEFILLSTIGKETTDL